MSKGRSLGKEILVNFWNAIKPRQIYGKCVGKDYNGTEYYEIPLSRLSTKRRPSRWFMPREQNNFEQDIPCEWEAWLRYRRDDPPTEEEIMKNLARIHLTKKNADELEKKLTQPSRSETKSTEKKSFPIYEDLEGMPGSSISRRKRN